MRRRCCSLLIGAVALISLFGFQSPLKSTGEGAFARSLIKGVPLVASRVESDRAQWIYTGPGSAKVLKAWLAKKIGKRAGWLPLGFGWEYGVSMDGPRSIDGRIVQVLIGLGKASNSGLPAKLKSEWRTVYVYEYLPSARGFPNSEFLKGWSVGR